MFVALLALLVALGGTATAGVLITGKQVKNGSLTGADVGNGSLTGKDVRNNSLTSKDVKNLKGTDIKNGSLTAADFAAGELPEGPAGPQGQPGPAGPVGPPGPLLDTLPTGATLRGVYDVTFTATAVSQFDTDAFNYGIPLASAPAANFVASGDTPPTPCTGTAAAPEAAPGHLCVYEASGSGYTGAVPRRSGDQRHRCRRHGHAHHSGLLRSRTDHLARLLGRNRSLERSIQTPLYPAHTRVRHPNRQPAACSREAATEPGVLKPGALRGLHKQPPDEDLTGPPLPRCGCGRQRHCWSPAEFGGRNVLRFGIDS